MFQIILAACLIFDGGAEVCFETPPAPALFESRTDCHAALPAAEAQARRFWERHGAWISHLEGACSAAEAAA
jgi:hypothetical protein